MPRPLRPVDSLPSLRHEWSVLALHEVAHVALERVRRKLGRTLPTPYHAALGLSLATLGCDPAIKVGGFVEPDSGRPYRVMAPATLDVAKPATVLFSLHAYATHPDIVLEGYSVLRHAVEDRGWLVVVPEGKLDGSGNYHWNASAACCGAGKRDADDIGYLHAVLQDVKRRYTIDAARVFAFGVSNGSFMAHRWACASDGDLAGIVSIAGAGQGADDPPCASSKRLSVVHVHGTRDDLIRFDGGNEPGRRYPGARDTVAHWVKANAITTNPVVTSRRSLFLTPVDVETWADNGVRVSAWTFQNGDHLLRDARFFMSDYLDVIAPPP